MYDATRSHENVAGRRTMKLDHVAIGAEDLELMRAFYEKYFGALANPKYENERKRFTSYFLTFPRGGRLELMHRPDIQKTSDSPCSHEYIGYAHLGGAARHSSSGRRAYEPAAGRRVSVARWTETNGRRILREHGC